MERNISTIQKRGDFYANSRRRLEDQVAALQEQLQDGRHCRSTLKNKIQVRTGALTFLRS
jgi:hypothetical protein